MGTDASYPTLTLARWQRLWAALGASRCDTALFGQLLTAWSEPQRHYHTQQHLHECLRACEEFVASAAKSRSAGTEQPEFIEINEDCEYRRNASWQAQQNCSQAPDNFDLLRTAADHPAEIELALWFHDAVYDVHAHDNEARSAEWARNAMQAAGIGDVIIQRVTTLILATRHEAEPQTGDQQRLLDIDLWILGAPAPRFAEYTQQVRAEYQWVPEAVYRERRAAILQQFLARPRLFHSEAFFQRFEQQARANLAQAIQQLR